MDWNDVRAVLSRLGAAIAPMEKDRLLFKE